MATRHFGMGWFGSLRRLLAGLRYGAELLGYEQPVPALAGVPMGSPRRAGSLAAEAWKGMVSWGKSLLGLSSRRHRGPGALYLEFLEQRQLMSAFQLANAYPVANTFQITGSRDAIDAHLYHLTFSTDSPSMESWSVQWNDGSQPQTLASDAQTVDHTFAGLTDPLITATALDGDGQHFLALVPSGLYGASWTATAGEYTFGVQASANGMISLHHATTTDPALVAAVMSWTQTQVGNLTALGNGHLLVDATVPTQGDVELQLTPEWQLQQAFENAPTGPTTRQTNRNVLENSSYGGFVMREYWAVDGSAISDLTNSDAYISGTPDAYSALYSLEFRDDYNQDSSGSRIQGYITAPEDGNYTFYLSDDTSAAMYLSSSADPQDASEIVAGYGTGFEHFNYESGGQSLQGGHTYYFELLEKYDSNSWGYGHMSVAWSDDHTLGQPEIISGDYLSAYDCPQFPAPSSVRGTADGATALTVTWRGSSEAGNHYTVTRTGGGTYVTFSTISPEGGHDDGNGNYTLIDSGLTPGTSYTYSVQGTDDSDNITGTATGSGATPALNVWLTTSSSVWRGCQAPLTVASNVYVGSVTYSFSMVANPTCGTLISQNGPSALFLLSTASHLTSCVVTVSTNLSSTGFNLPLTVNDTPPLTTISGNSSVDEGQPYSLTLSGSTQSDGEHLASWTVNWGNGTETLSGTSAGVSHTYPDNLATYPISAVAYASDGTSAPAKIAVATTQITLAATDSGVYSLSALANQSSNSWIYDTISLTGGNTFENTTSLQVWLDGQIHAGISLYPLWRNWFTLGDGSVLWRYEDAANRGLTAGMVGQADHLRIQWTKVHPTADASSTAATFQVILSLNTGTNNAPVMFSYISVPSEYFAPTDGSGGPGWVGATNLYLSYGQPWGTHGTITNLAIMAQPQLPVAVVGQGMWAWPNYSAGIEAGSVQLNGSPTLVNGALRLTGGPGEAGSAYFLRRLNDNSFSTDFTFQITDTTSGAGWAFVIQNQDSPTTLPTAIGNSSQGFGGLTNCLAMAFDLTGSDTVRLYQSGQLNGSGTSLSALDWHSGDVLTAHVNCTGGTLTLTLTDTSETTSALTASWAVNIPTVVGSSSGYFGFTAASAADTAVQDIQSWTYQPLASSSQLAFVSGPTAVMTGDLCSRSLSVVASDAQNGTDVTCAWYVADSAPGLVSFVDNDSPTATQTVATFSSAGTYTLWAKLTDSTGVSLYSDPLTLTVGQTLASIVVNSTQSTPGSNGTQLFTAVGFDQFGYPLTPQPSFTWSQVGGSSITANGSASTLHFASYISYYYVTAGVSESPTSDTVYYSTSPYIVSTTAQLDASCTSADLTVQATDSHGGTDLTYTWVVTGSNAASVSLWDATSATPIASFASAGTYSFLVTASGSTNTSHTLYVTVPQVVTSLYVIPNNGVPSGVGYQSFHAVAYDQFGDPLSVQPAYTLNFTGTGVTWGSNYVTSDSTNSSYQVFASFQGITSDTLSFSQLLPLPPTVTASATVNTTTATLDVVGSDVSGSEADLTYTWSVDGPNAGFVSFSDNEDNTAKHTTATFAMAGTYEFMVTISNLAGLTTTACESVAVGQVATSIAITTNDSAPTLSTDHQVFTATEYDQFGNPMAQQPTSFAWSRTGSDYSITPTGSHGTVTLAATDQGSYAVAASTGSIFSNALHFSPNLSLLVSANQTVSSSGTSAVLSVLGTDVHGGSDLRYTWEVTSANSANVSFFDNDDLTAATTMAYFSEAGDYTFQVTISDGTTPLSPAPSPFTFNVPQVLTSIVAQPASADDANITFDLEGDGTQHFSATAYDQFGQPLLTPPTSYDWSVVGNGNAYAIDGTGQLTTRAVAGSYIVVARTSTAGGTVNSQPLEFSQGVSVTLAASANLDEEETSAYLYVGGVVIDTSAGPLTYTWTTTDNSPGGVTFSSNGDSASACPTVTFAVAGTYTFLVTMTDSEGHSSTSVTSSVTVDPHTASVQVRPLTPLTGVTQQFAATAYDQFGTPMASQPAFTWNVDGTNYSIVDGTLTSGGSPSAAYTVFATADGNTGSLAMTRTFGLTSASATADASGVFATLNAVANDSLGGADLTFTWSVVDGNPNNVWFSDNGDTSAATTQAYFAAAGTYQFLVTISDSAGNTLASLSTSDVIIQSVLTSIAVSTPDPVPLGGDYQNFTAVAYNQFGQRLFDQPGFDWVVSGSGYQISEDGSLTLTSGFDPSSYTVNVYPTGISTEVFGTLGQDALAPVFTADITQTPSSDGTSVTLSAPAVDMSGNVDLTYTWYASDDAPGFVDFSAEDPFNPQIATATFYAAGAYHLFVTVFNDAGLSVTSGEVDVVVGQQATSLHFASNNPPISAGEEQDFTVEVDDQFGMPMDSTPSVEWTLAGDENDLSPDGLTAHVTAGAETGTFTLRASCETITGTAYADATLAIEATVRTPTLVDPEASVDENSYVYFSVLTGASDIDTIPNSIYVTTQPSHGIVLIYGDGTAYYTPDHDYHGADDFEIQVANHDGSSAVQDVTVTVDYTAPSPYTLTGPDIYLENVDENAVTVDLSRYVYIGDHLGSLTYGVESSAGCSVDFDGSLATVTITDPDNFQWPQFNVTDDADGSWGTFEFGPFADVWNEPNFTDYSAVFNLSYNSHRDVNVGGNDVSIGCSCADTTTVHVSISGTTVSLATTSNPTDTPVAINIYGYGTAWTVNWTNDTPDDTLSLECEVPYTQNLSFPGSLSLGVAGISNTSTIQAAAITGGVNVVAGTLTSTGAIWGLYVTDILEKGAIHADSTINATVYGNVLGSLTAGGSLDAEIIGNLEGTVGSDASYVDVWVNGLASGDVYADTYLYVYNGDWWEDYHTWPLRSGIGITGSLNCSDGSVYAVSGLDIAADISAATGLSLTAGGSVSGTMIAAEGDITINAGKTVGGTIEASNGNIDFIQANQNIDADISAFGDEAGMIEDLWSKAGSIAGTIHAAHDIGSYMNSYYCIWADLDMSADVTSDAGLVYVYAGRDITGNVSGGPCDALGNAQRFWAGRNVTGDISGDYIDSVWAGGTITGAITAQHDIGSVTAGRAILGDIEAGEGAIGNIDSVIAGSDGSMGDGIATGLIGPVTIHATGYIGSISALAALGYDSYIAGATISADGGDIGSISASSGIDATVSAQGSIWAIDPAAGLAGMYAVGGDLAGSFTAVTGSLPDIKCKGSISAALTAGGDIGNITSYQDISGTILATGNVASVTASFGNISGNITSTTGGIGLVSAGGNITNNILVGSGHLDIMSSGNISGNISGTDNISLTAGGDVSGNLFTSFGNIVLFTGGAVTSNTVQAIGDICITAGSDVEIAAIAADGDVSVSAEGDISTPSVRSTYGKVTESATGYLSTNVTASTRVSLIGSNIRPSPVTVAGNENTLDMSTPYPSAVGLFALGPNDNDGGSGAPAGPASTNKQQVLAFFKLLFGDKGQQLLDAFFASSHENALNFGQYHSLSSISVSGVWGFGKNVVTIDISTQLLTRHWYGPFWSNSSQNVDPATAAAELYRQLEVAFVEDASMRNAWLDATAGLPGDDSERLWKFEEAAAQNFKEQAQNVATIAEAYIRGITMLNEGANVVVSLGDIADGDYLAALNLIPVAGKLASRLGAAGKVRAVVKGVAEPLVGEGSIIGRLLEMAGKDGSKWRIPAKGLSQDVVKYMKNVIEQFRPIKGVNFFDFPGKEGIVKGGETALGEFKVVGGQPMIYLYKGAGTPTYMHELLHFQQFLNYTRGGLRTAEQWNSYIADPQVAKALDDQVFQWLEGLGFEKVR